MLVLSRKSGEQVVIGSDIVITMLASKGNRVMIGIDAPQSVRVRRSELPKNGLEGLDSVESVVSSIEVTAAAAKNRPVLVAK